jgi:SWI/SNF-related matrix-associated actin-dependent regulator of chromatin subfamily A3
MDKKCPLCAISGVHTSVVPPDAGMEERGDSYLRQEGHSSKMMALLSDIQEDLWQTKR